jgi:hypothetical protein
MISEERILGKFTRARRERPAAEALNSLVAKTEAPTFGNTPRECASWGGEVITNAPLCRKKR